MKTAAIDKELWDNIYNVYVKDELNLGVKKYFEQQNPAALEEMTAVMLESARKGLWKASEEQVAELSKLHTEIVNNYRPSCSSATMQNYAIILLLKQMRQQPHNTKRISPKSVKQKQAEMTKE